MRSPPMEALVTEFGGAKMPSTSLDDLLVILETFSSQWDYRRGAERSSITKAHLGSASERLIVEAATALGLNRPVLPAHDRFDHILILGGLASACFARCLGAADFVRASHTRPSAITALGADRPLGAGEMTNVGYLLAKNATNEFDALDAGLRLAFCLGGASDDDWDPKAAVPGRPRWIRNYSDSRGIPIQVIAAPTVRLGAMRANTAETMEMFARNIGGLAEGERLLLLTTSLYAPYQHAEGLRTLWLPYRSEVEVYGVHPREMDQRFAPRIEAHHYLQEIRSTICALGRLLRSITGTEEQESMAGKAKTMSNPRPLA